MTARGGGYGALSKLLRRPGPLMVGRGGPSKAGSLVRAGGAQALPELRSDYCI